MFPKLIKSGENVNSTFFCRPLNNSIADLFFNFAAATSAWLAVSFTVERFVAVCYPMKGKLFCTERKAKTLIAMIYVFCLVTTASRTFEYTMSLDEFCVRKCNPGEKPPYLDGENATTAHHTYKLPEHTIMLPHDSNFTSIEQYNEYFQTQLKAILANCTQNPHIIYVPFFQYPFNFTPEKFAANLVNNNQLVLESQGDSANEVEKSEHILDKSPADAAASNETAQELLTDMNNDTKTDNVSCCTLSHKVYINETFFGKNPGYRTFIYWYSAIVFNIIPFVLIATFNCFLVKAVYKSRGMRRTMTNNSQVSKYDTPKLQICS